MLTSKQKGVISDVVQRLMRAPASPANLDAEKARLLSEALVRFGEEFPDIAEDVSAYIDYTTMVLGVHEIKTGKGGTWSQITLRHAKELRQILSRRRIA